LAAVYCQPSFAEGFGIPVLEALASGTPVACSQIPSLLEIAGEAALYFDPGKQSEMTKVLHQLLIDSRLRSRLRLQGPAQSAKFSWAKTAAQTLQVYRELLD
jgi:alpha-1,3-rhamnosyl/mannosyltransferase